MKGRSLLALSLAAVTAACEQETQSLPFDVTSTAAVTRAVSPATGATLSTPMGATVTFPAGAFDTNTTVTLAPGAAPAAFQTLGTVASNGAFAISPSGVELQEPATVDLRLASQMRGHADAWLASMVNSHSSTPVGIGHGMVDLSTGIVRSRLRQTGTIALVIPGSQSWVPLQRITPGAESVTHPALVSGTVMPSQVRGRCAAAPCANPADRISATLSAPAGALPDLGTGAVIFWSFSGAFDVAPGGATEGTIEGDFPLRIAMTPARAGATAPVVAVSFRVTLEALPGAIAVPTAEGVTISPVRFTIRWSEDEGSQNVNTFIQPLEIVRTAEGGLVALSRSFDFAGQQVSIRVTVPVALD